MDSSGEVRYVDDYGAVYSTAWRTTDMAGTELLDFTTIVTTPYVWGQPISGKVVNKQVIRDGMCTITRTVLTNTDSGYEIVAEGGMSYTCEVPLEFKKESSTSPFLHDLNYEVTGRTQVTVSIGPHFTDPDVNGDSCVFGDVGGGTEDVFEFIDIWE